MNALQQRYHDRATKFATTAETLRAKYTRFSIIRLLAFIVGIGLIILLWNAVHPLAGVASIVIFLLAFGRFIIWHIDIQRQQKHQELLAKVNENELQFAQYNYAHFDGGSDFIDAEHPYSVDLDIFGDYSFYQYTNRTATAIGRVKFADYLKNLASPDVVKERQAAVQELKEYLDWRQHFQAFGLSTEDDIQHVNALQKWLHEPPFVSNNKVYKILIPLAFPLFVAGIVSYFSGLPGILAILFVAPMAWALKKTVEQVNETHSQTAKAEQILAHYARLVQHIENQTFTSKKLLELQAVFSEGSAKASEKIEQLSYIIRQLNVRNNFFAIFLNLGGLWDLRYVLKLEKWRAEQQDSLPKWFASLAEFEALLSFSTLHYNHPNWIFPTVHETAVVEMDDIGHPLIDAEKRVCNDINIPTEGHIKLITGSNMAGKSTFLRTVGLNLILAQTGAPVCAKALSTPPLEVYTSMRTQDALHESTSSFYAELKRLKFIIEAVEAGKKVFFLLDEILKGTNSKDRHTGSKALIRQLIDARGSGIIATHDLELGALAEKYGGAIENLRIEVEIEAGKLHFDYKVKKGVSESFNATILMQQMGIRISDL